MSPNPRTIAQQAMGCRMPSAVESAPGFDDVAEDRLLEGCALPSYAVALETDEPVEPNLARTPLGVPAARPDVLPAAAVARLLGGVTVVVLAAEHQHDPAVAVRVEQQDRPVLAPARVVLVGHPAPDDLAGIRL